MTQNLALDIVHENDNETDAERLEAKTAYALATNGDRTKLTNSNTNIPENYEIALPITKYSVTDKTETTDTGISWNPADNPNDRYVLNFQYMNENETWENGYNALYGPGTLSKQPFFFTQVINTPDETWTADYIAADNKTYDTEQHRYDAHFLTGNWYQNSTAHARSTADKQDFNASICPSGWKLPSYQNNTPGSWQNLFAQYGISNGYSTEGTDNPL